MRESEAMRVCGVLGVYFDLRETGAFGAQRVHPEHKRHLERGVLPAFGETTQESEWDESGHSEPQVLGVGDEASHYSIEKKEPFVCNPLYSCSTQEMYDFNDYDRPELRYLPKDESNNFYGKTTNPLEQAKQFDIFPVLNNTMKPLNPEQGPFAILGKEDTLGMKLGDATADDLLYLAKRVKKMRQKVLDMKEIIDFIYDVKYCGKDIASAAKEFMDKKRAREETIKKHLAERAKAKGKRVD